MPISPAKKAPSFSHSHPVGQLAMEAAVLGPWSRQPGHLEWTRSSGPAWERAPRDVETLGLEMSRTYLSIFQDLSTSISISNSL